MLNKIIDFQQNARLNALFLKTLDKILADTADTGPKAI
jgi:hypothetical protein